MAEIYKVFLSSTAADLDAWRTAVQRALDRMDGVDVVWMKDWVAQDTTSMQVCERKVRSSDIFVGLIGHCFGSAPEVRPDRSFTMLEYDWAVDAGLPRLIHRAPGSFNLPANLIEDERLRGLQKAFREEISGWHTGQRESWLTPDRLAADVAEAVRIKLDEFRLEARVNSLVSDLDRCLKEKEKLRITIWKLTEALQELTSEDKNA